MEENQTYYIIIAKKKGPADPGTDETLEAARSITGPTNSLRSTIF